MARAKAEDGPAAEMLLAEMLAGAKGAGLGWRSGMSGVRVTAAGVVPNDENCCALGGAALERGVKPDPLPADYSLPCDTGVFDRYVNLPAGFSAADVYQGNDDGTEHGDSEFVGNCFAVAMGAREA